MLYKMKIVDNIIDYITEEEYNKKVKMLYELDYDCEGEPEEHRKARKQVIWNIKNELKDYVTISKEKLNEILNKN